MTPLVKVPLVIVTVAAAAAICLCFAVVAVASFYKILGVTKGRPWPTTWTSPRIRRSTTASG
jgi:hypothetical protein